MFWDDIKLVTEQVERYGLRQPFVDLGGCDSPCIADYDLTLATGDQGARYVTVAQRPLPPRRSRSDLANGVISQEVSS